MSDCPLLIVDYDEDFKRSYRCGSIKPHALEVKVYTKEEEKALKPLWPIKVYSKYYSEGSCNHNLGSHISCDFYRATIRPYLEKAGYKENGKCLSYIRHFKAEVKDDMVLVECKNLASRASFDAQKPLPCLTNCYDCRRLWEIWWREPGRCKFQKVISDKTYREDDGYGYMKDVRYITFYCKVQEKECTIKGPDKCDRWKYECEHYNKARVEEIGFKEAKYLPR